MRRPGFTVLELATAVALLVLFVTIAIPTYRAFEGGGEDAAARQRLAAIEVELARAQADNGGVFPADVHTRVAAGSEVIVDGSTESSGPASLSLQTLSGTAVAGTVLADSGNCLVAVFAVNDPPRWAVDNSPVAGSCRADHPTIESEWAAWPDGEDATITLG